MRVRKENIYNIADITVVGMNITQNIFSLT